MYIGVSGVNNKLKRNQLTVGNFKSHVTCIGTKTVSLVKFQGRDPKLNRPFL